MKGCFIFKIFKRSVLKLPIYQPEKGLFDIDRTKLNSGITVYIECINWNNATEKLGYTDYLSVNIISKECYIL